MGTQFQDLFNHDDIEKGLCAGYETEERQAFLEELSKVYNK